MPTSYVTIELFREAASRPKGAVRVPSTRCFYLSPSHTGTVSHFCGEGDGYLQEQRLPWRCGRCGEQITAQKLLLAQFQWLKAKGRTCGPGPS